MKRMIISAVLFVMFLICHATAQVPLRQAAAVSKDLARGSSAVRTLSVRPIDPLPLIPQKPVRPVLPPTVSTGPTQQWITNNQRLLINLQRLWGTSTIQAIRNVRKWGAQYPRKNPRPVLQTDQSFRRANLAGLSVPESQIKDMPPHPFQNQRLLIYRGLALDVDGRAVRNILENGLLLKDVGPYANTLLYSLSGPYSRSRSVQNPVINLTDNSDSAANWAKTRKSPNQICVVTVVQSNQTGRTIMHNHDIPSDAIYAVTALLMVNGTPAWCKVEWDNGEFLITPYQSAQP